MIESNGKQSSWFHIAFQAVVAGVSAATCYHLLQQPGKCALVKSRFNHLLRQIAWQELPLWVLVWPVFSIPNSHSSSTLWWLWTAFLGSRLLVHNLIDESDKEEHNDEKGSESEETVPSGGAPSDAKGLTNVSKKQKDKKQEAKGCPVSKELQSNSQESSDSSVGSYKQSKQSRPSRYVELLVHNVSHSDIILSVDLPKKSADDDYCLCRPRFSFFDLYSRQVLESLSGQENIIHFPRYQRSIESPRFSINKDPASTYPPTPTGLSLLHTPNVDYANVRLRGRDQPRWDHATDPTAPLKHVFFPLLATLLPRWKEQMHEKGYKTPPHRVLILVSGVGTPRNWTHSVTGNSTEACAQLMAHFLQRIDPELTVRLVHSDSNIFRYDENLVFVQRELMPAIHAYRDAHAKGLPYPQEDDQEGFYDSQQHSFDTDWKKSFAVTLSFADGSPARTYAIQASLRPYKPSYFHFWQLKTFWHESKIVDDDIEGYSYEEMEVRPAVDVDRLTDPNLQKLVQEMKSFRNQVRRVMSRQQHDWHQFWLRKTHKPVLAVLWIQTPEMPEPVFYRGTNMEVSMPTGSLCAERNVIGTALAENPNLRREDLKMIAVLALPFPTAELERVPSYTTLSDRKWSMGSEYDRKGSIGSEADHQMENESLLPIGEQDQDGSFTMIDPIEGQPAPVRKISLFQSTSKSKRKTVWVHSNKDLNPLAPCGACNEWLKKIAECNPYFQVVTFTDAECNGVYAMSCQE